MLTTGIYPGNTPDPATPRPEAALSAGAPPIRIERLVKRYRNGVTAVNGLDLTVLPGQVFGLLGLNGAGKTTTLRVLLGLARPTSGRVTIFGEPVTPGAPVLRNAGSLVDAPGFVPHLSGRDNLRLEWAATGGPAGTGVVEQALALAALGDATDRPVRSYSFGMRQRLAIARAALGNPPLLVLDEPTTGLDPRQVREVRALIRSLPSRGTTVLLSTHLLSEVEQICSHAAVINEGRLAAAGSIAELTRANDSVFVEVDDPDKAMVVLASTPGLHGLASDTGGIVVGLGTLDRREIARILVQAGVGIVTIASRRTLEDAFLGLLAAEPAH